MRDLRLDRPKDLSIDARIGPILDRWTDSPILPATGASALNAAMPAALPGDGAPIEEVLREVEAVAVHGARRNAHPGYFGYICGAGLPTDPLAHALVGALNQNVTSFSSAPGAVTMERRVVAWIRALAGMPEGADGLFLGGGSIANLTALAVARRAAPDKTMLYTTREAHFTIRRAARLLGFDVRLVACDAERRMRPEALAEALDRGRAAGEVPFAVAATAGTTTTGAVDPLASIARICRGHGIWLHVDASYGGGALLSDSLRGRLLGIEEADSVCIDLHKWFYLGFDAGVLVWREPRRARELFHSQADYVRLPAEGTPEEYAFYYRGPETSRRFRALPAYIALRHYGTRLLGRNVENNVACADHLARRVVSHPDLELVQAPQLSVVCFRHAPPDVREKDARNAAIRDRLEAEGDFYLSPTVLDGQAVLRVCVLSHATRIRHIDALVDAVVRIGRGFC